MKTDRSHLTSSNSSTWHCCGTGPDPGCSNNPPHTLEVSGGGRGRGGIECPADGRPPPVYQMTGDYDGNVSVISNDYSDCNQGNGDYYKNDRHRDIDGDCNTQLALVETATHASSRPGFDPIGTMLGGGPATMAALAHTTASHLHAPAFGANLRLQLEHGPYNGTALMSGGGRGRGR